MSFLIGLALGYLIARLDEVRNMLKGVPTNGVLSGLPFVNSTNINAAPRAATRVQIDERTFVTEVPTDTLEKSYDKLGDTVVLNDSIEGSVSKLAQMKGKKK